jgi:2-keto-3-deoxy-L-fuconate dehydrogenase
MTDMFDLSGKTAIVTGGSSGIGRAISITFAKRGATVFNLDLDSSGAKETVNRISDSGGKALFFECDVSHPDQVESAVNKILGQQGNLDIVINNAGIAHIGDVESTSREDFDRILSVNVKGVFHVMQSTIPHLKKKGGVILNIASVAARVGLSDRFAYSASKAAIVGMTLSVAKDYLKYNIRCNSISPARVHTPFVDGFLKKNYPGKEQEMFEKLSRTQPIGRMGQPEEIAHLALYLCSNEASFITGSDYPIDGGFISLNT